MTRATILAAALAAAAAPAWAQGPAALTASPPPYAAGDPPDRPNPFATVAIDAGYGGLAGLLAGAGWALIERNSDHWGRDLSIGAGVGVLVGAGVGVYQAVSDERALGDERRLADRLAAMRPDRVALDGLSTPARDPVVRQPPWLAMSGRF